MFPIKLVDSLLKARGILKEFNPQVVVGVGGFASGPTLYVASKMGIPAMVQEQNSYPGLTNKWLARQVDKICVAYDGMERFFPNEKLVFTGNPVRGDLESNLSKREARAHFGLAGEKRTIFVVGGSLGARTFNRVMDSHLKEISDASSVQWLWQIGKIYRDQYLKSATAKLENVQAQVFVDRMDLAYRAADLIICRAGALTISELCLLGKPALLVPSPNVAEDHQTVNAKSLVKEKAARMITDENAPLHLIDIALQLIHAEKELQTLAEQAKSLARPRATNKIVEEILALAK